MQYQVPSLDSYLRRNIGDAAQLTVKHGGRHRPLAGPVTRTAQRWLGLEQHGYGRQSGTSRECEPSEPALSVEPKRVHDGRQPPPRTGDDDLVEQGERVHGGVEVVLAAAHYGAEQVRGHNLPGEVPLGGPACLASARCAHEHDEGRIRDRESWSRQIWFHGSQRRRTNCGRTVISVLELPAA